MTLTKLCSIAENENILLATNTSSSKISTIINIENVWLIDTNPTKISTENQEKQCLAHELGHYFTGAVYNETTTPIQRARCEYRANKWTVNVLVPARALRKALESGITEVWDLAEYFDVSEETIHRAFYLYERQGIILTRQQHLLFSLDEVK